EVLREASLAIARQPIGVVEVRAQPQDRVTDAGAILFGGYGHCAGLDLLDCREQPASAGAAREGPHLLRLDRVLRAPLDDVTGIAGIESGADVVVERGPA